MQAQNNLGNLVTMISFVMTIFYVRPASGILASYTAMIYVVIGPVDLYIMPLVVVMSALRYVTM